MKCWELQDKILSGSFLTLIEPGKGAEAIKINCDL